MATIGACSNCHGPVTVPDMWGGSIPPTPKCEQCGASPLPSFGTVIPMGTPTKKPDDAVMRRVKEIMQGQKKPMKTQILESLVTPPYPDWNT